MAFKFLDRVKEKTTTTGQGDITLGGALAGFQTLVDAGMADGDTTPYAITDGNSWEEGHLTYHTGNTASRTVDKSTNGNAPLNLSGNAIVIATARAADLTNMTPSGTVVFTIKQAAPSGWLLFNDGTAGNPASGATYAAADAESLFTDLYTFSDANCPLLTNTGAATTRAAQGTAAAAWAAGCRISLPKVLGRSLAAAGSGSGLTSRGLGASVGAETHSLALAESPAHTHPVSGSTSGSLSASVSTALGFLVFFASSGSRFGNDPSTGTGYSSATSMTGSATGSLSVSGTASSQGGGGAHNNMQPTTFLNAMVKL